MNKIIRLDYNDPAPDLDITTASGEVIRLSSLWSDRTLVLAFTRHYG